MNTPRDALPFHGGYQAILFALATLSDEPGFLQLGSNTAHRAFGKLHIVHQVFLEDASLAASHDGKEHLGDMPPAQ